MVEPYVVVREAISFLHKSVANFTSEQITTPEHDVWSVKKLIALYSYIKPYCEIMRKQGFKKLHYVDLFSGSGLLNINNKILPGTPLVPFTRLKEGYFFDDYFLSDGNGKFVVELEKRAKSMLNSTSHSLTTRHLDFKNAVQEKFGIKRGQYKDNGYLVVLDPFGFDVSWDALVDILRGRSVDVFITFMTKATERNKNIAHSENSLNNMFGDSSWKQSTDLLKLYREKIEKIPSESWYPYKTTVIAVETAGNSKYHLIFASRAHGAHKPFSWIQTHIDKVDKNLLKDAFTGGTIHGSNIDHFT